MTEKKDYTSLLIGAVLVLFIVAAFEGYELFSMSSKLNKGSSAGTSLGGSIDVIPKGVPKIYGAELSLSYDDVSPADQAKANAAINKLAALDTSIQLSGEALQRYINIAGSISCEYCCGAQSIIFTKDSGQYKAGDAACGCAHSYAMRGLAKYLLKEHGGQYSDSEILEEMGKWKTLFFPSQITQKAGVLKQQGVELSYINLASNKYRGIEQSSGSGSGMVGGC